MEEKIHLHEQRWQLVSYTTSFGVTYSCTYFFQGADYYFFETIGGAQTKLYPYEHVYFSHIVNYHLV